MCANTDQTLKSTQHTDSSLFLFYVFLGHQWRWLCWNVHNYKCLCLFCVNLRLLWRTMLCVSEYSNHIKCTNKSSKTLRCGGADQSNRLHIRIRRVRTHKGIYIINIKYSTNFYSLLNLGALVNCSTNFSIYLMWKSTRFETDYYTLQGVRGAGGSRSCTDEREKRSTGRGICVFVYVQIGAMAESHTIRKKKWEIVCSCVYWITPVDNCISLRKGNRFGVFNWNW